MGGSGRSYIVVVVRMRGPRGLGDGLVRQFKQAEMSSLRRAFASTSLRDTLEESKTSVHVVALISHQKISILWVVLTLLMELTLRSWKLVTLKCAVSNSTQSIPPNPNECIVSSICVPSRKVFKQKASGS